MAKANNNNEEKSFFGAVTEMAKNSANNLLKRQHQKAAAQEAQQYANNLHIPYNVTREAMNNVKGDFNLLDAQPAHHETMVYGAKALVLVFKERSINKNRVTDDFSMLRHLQNQINVELTKIYGSCLNSAGRVLVAACKLESIDGHLHVTVIYNRRNPNAPTAINHAWNEAQMPPQIDGQMTFDEVLDDVL